MLSQLKLNDMMTTKKKNTARPKASLRNCSEHYWENGAHFFKESAAVLVLGCEKMLLWIQIKAVIQFLRERSQCSVRERPVILVE